VVTKVTEVQDVLSGTIVAGRVTAANSRYLKTDVKYRLRPKLDYLYIKLKNARHAQSAYLRSNAEKVRSSKGKTVWHPDANFEFKVYRGMKNLRDRLVDQINAIKKENYEKRTGEAKLKEPKYERKGNEWVEKKGKFVDVSDRNAQRKARYAASLPQTERESDVMHETINVKKRNVKRQGMRDHKILGALIASSLPGSVHAAGSKAGPHILVSIMIFTLFYIVGLVLAHFAEEIPKSKLFRKSTRLFMKYFDLCFDKCDEAVKKIFKKNVNKLRAKNKFLVR
jgi:hypothetical protein